jgi:hypothetical protein
MKFKRKSKGAYAVVEQMILFAIGVAVVIGIAGVYSAIKTGTRDISIEDQFREISELTLSNLIYVYNTGRALNSSLFIHTYNVPLTAAQEPYRIELTNNTIYIEADLNTNLNYTLKTLGLNHSIALTGNATSYSGKVKVNYNSTANSISIETST